MPGGVVIAGAGQAGFQLAASLRADGYEESIVIIGEEPGLPYQRPPLSKAFMAGKQAIEGAILRPEAFYRDHQIELLTGERVTAIDRANRSVTLASHRRLRYQTLALATGSRNRTLPLKGVDLAGVCYLRTREEAIEIKQRIEYAREIVIIGGGFIGLELAAVARSLGKPVQVLEAQPRLMPRVLPSILSDFYRELHSSAGVAVSLGVAISEVAGHAGKVTGVFLNSGEFHPADLVLVGIGAVPNIELAAEAGLDVGNGIVVDQYLRTGDENVYAIGDCTDHPNPHAGGRARLESVQNAVDQAKCVAAAIVGRGEPYRAVPWFWTDQFDAKLQMVGLSAGHDRIAIRGEPESRKFSVFYFRENRLAAIDSVNRPVDHMAGRKLLAAGTELTPEQASDSSVDLKVLLQPAASIGVTTS